MKDLATNTRDKPSQIFAKVVSQCDDNVQAIPLVAQLGTTSVAWYNLHFRLMIVTVNRFLLIVLYLILKTISLEQLTTERQGYKFLTVYTCITFQETVNCHYH
jgi:hypothetical protein